MQYLRSLFLIFLLLLHHIRSKTVIRGDAVYNLSAAICVPCKTGYPVCWDDARTHGRCTARIVQPWWKKIRCDLKVIMLWLLYFYHSSVWLLFKNILNYFHYGMNTNTTTYISHIIQSYQPLYIVYTSLTLTLTLIHHIRSHLMTASGGGDKAVRFWNVITSMPQHTCIGNTNQILILHLIYDRQ